MVRRLAGKALLLVSLVFNLILGNNYWQNNQVVAVADGDTFQLKSGKRVRLMNVDSPEYDRCGGPEAKERLNELVSGKRVFLKEEVIEAYGRSLALVYSSGQLINEIMLKEGWGRQDYRKNSQRDRLTQAFHEGKDNKRGIFSELCYKDGEIEGDCLIKGNIDPATSQKFYHLPSCKHYNQTVIQLDRGEKLFCSEAEAQSAGFVKASGCE